jgi:hypothetical protein
MKRAVWLISGCALLALMTISQGCGSKSSPALPAAAPPPPDAPHAVTDLSQLAPGNALDPFGKQEETIARHVVEGDDGKAPPQQQGIEHLDSLATVRHGGDDRHPCEQQMLNKKAAQFDVLSIRLMDQVFHQMRTLQTGEISRMKLPSDLRWVVITARMDHQGTLKELVLEQHSGTAAMDKLMIEACKKALYLRNPPADAADGDGDYKVRIEARMENYSSMDGEHWEFKTYMGLAIL